MFRTNKKEVKLNGLMLKDIVIICIKQCYILIFLKLSLVTKDKNVVLPLFKILQKRKIFTKFQLSKHLLSEISYFKENILFYNIFVMLSHV